MHKTTIGLEIHVQLKTKSKMFCGCDNKADEAPPNTLVCPVCLGLPGVLPAANHQAIEWVIKTGLALNCEIADFARFDRKHYFYPDLPKGYQISQYDKPFCLGGKMEIRNLPAGPLRREASKAGLKSEIRNISIRRIHLEEDAGKLVHAGDNSLVDFNRAGTPLMEIVTEPEINSPTEAKVFLQELRVILRCLGVSDADMEKGHLRCDANISLTHDSQLTTHNLGTPVEIKNINSFRMLERALSHEEERQRELLKKGEKVVKETRGWDDTKRFTYSQRSKEQAQDYRYFPEPDLPPFEIPKLFNIQELKRTLPELPPQREKRYIDEFGLNSFDAAFLARDKTLSQYFEKASLKSEPRLAANWIINELKMVGISKVSPENLARLLQMLQAGAISGKMAKDVLSQMISSGQTAAQIIEKQGFRQVGDENELIKIVEKVLTDNPGPLSDYHRGKKEALRFLVGQVMRETRGQANPQAVNQLLLERIKDEKKE